jgi:hypothetical protein
MMNLSFDGYVESINACSIRDREPQGEIGVTGENVKMSGL